MTGLFFKFRHLFLTILSADLVVANPADGRGLELDDF